MAASSDAVEIVDLAPDDHRIDAVIALAARVLQQDGALVRDFPHAFESHLVAAFARGQAVGFLRLLVQVMGSEEGRPPILQGGVALTEGYVEAFGVEPSVRRRGIGTALQRRAVELARASGCHQMRSRSPVTSRENYALKIAAGYVAMPSERNDSYYFLLGL